MSDLYQTSADLRAATQDLARQEQPAAALTLTRTNTLAITTAGTTITWESATRNQGFTWSGTTITIPTSGFYLFNFVFKITTTNQIATAELSINTFQQSLMATSNTVTNTKSFTQMLYCTTGDAVILTVTPTNNDTIALAVEGANRPSPILHVVQLTGAVS
jgi:hypothetical protein